MKTALRSIIPFLAVGGVACSALWMYCDSVPHRQLPGSTFFTESKNPVNVGSEFDASIARARGDYFFFPVSFRSPRKLAFEAAYAVAPNDLNLVFYLKDDPADFVVVYRVDRQTGRLLWKAGVSTE